MVSNIKIVIIDIMVFYYNLHSEVLYQLMSNLEHQIPKKAKYQ